MAVDEHPISDADINEVFDGVEEVEEWPTEYPLSDSKVLTTSRGKAENSGKVRLTYVFELQVSRKKASQLRNYISEAQTIRRHAAHVLRSYRPDQWGGNTPVYSAIKDSYSDSNLNSGNRSANMNKVGEAFATWEANGHREGGAEPPNYGTKEYVVLRGSKIELWENKKGVTVKIGGTRGDGTDPDRADSFDLPMVGGQHQMKATRAALRGDVSIGRSEVRYNDRLDRWELHLSISYEQPVYHPDDVDRWIGIDLGYSALYSAAIVRPLGREENSPKGNGIDVESITYGPGTELKAKRRQQKESLRHLQETKGNAVASDRLGSKLRTHVDQLEDRYANDIVALAADNRSCGLVFENIKGMGEIGWAHLWAYHRFREKIKYKAHQKGIPVMVLSKGETRYTSMECSACGLRTSKESPYGRIHRGEFVCPDPDCGYGPVNADGNAAVNIVRRLLDR